MVLWCCSAVVLHSFSCIVLVHRAETSLSNRFRTLHQNAHKQQHAYKRAGTGTWRYECGCGCGGIAAGARCGWRRWYGVQGGYELQERERDGADADAARIYMAARNTGRGGAYTSCRNGIVGVSFKQKKRNKSRSNKKTPASNDASV